MQLRKQGVGSQFASGERFLTVGAVARYFGVTEVTIKNWVDAGQLLAARTVGGHRRVAASSVVSRLEQQGLAVPQDLARSRPVVLAAVADVSLQKALRKALSGRFRVEQASSDYDALLLLARLAPELLVIETTVVDPVKLLHALRQDAELRHVDVVLVGAPAPALRQAMDAHRGAGTTVLVNGDASSVMATILPRAERAAAPRVRRRLAESAE